MNTDAPPLPPAHPYLINTLDNEHNKLYAQQCETLFVLFGRKVESPESNRPRVRTGYDVISFTPGQMSTSAPLRSLREWSPTLPPPPPAKTTLCAHKRWGAPGIHIESVGGKG